MTDGTACSTHSEPLVEKGCLPIPDPAIMRLRHGGRVMRKSTLMEEQIIGILAEADKGAIE